jgi:nucleotidyltransferase/DNA polymerase involved in DNA repair
MAQVCSVMGEGLGLLPNRALSASVRRPSANDIVLPPRHKAYQEYSAHMMTILSEYSSLIRDLDVQPFAL